MPNQSNITSPTHPRIAIVFDYDDTLAKDSTSSFLKWLDLNPDHFWDDRVKPLVKKGWDPLPAQFQVLKEISIKREAKRPITKSLLAEFGRQHRLFEGVEEMFDTLKKQVRKSGEKIDLEFYLLSCGLGDIICNSIPKKEFKKIWTSEFHYNEEEEIDFPKVFVTHTEKSRFIHRISKGLMDDNHPDRLFEANRVVEPEDLHLPLSQMIYVGDGFTDIPCFEIVTKANGIAIGVDKPESSQRWGASGGYSQAARVVNLAMPDYTDNSEMMKTLKLAIESLCAIISIREMSRGE